MKGDKEGSRSHRIRGFAWTGQKGVTRQATLPRFPSWHDKSCSREPLWPVLPLWKGDNPCLLKMRLMAKCVTPPVPHSQVNPVIVEQHVSNSCPLWFPLLCVHLFFFARCCCSKSHTCMHPPHHKHMYDKFIIVAPNQRVGVCACATWRQRRP